LTDKNGVASESARYFWILLERFPAEVKHAATRLQLEDSERTWTTLNADDSERSTAKWSLTRRPSRYLARRRPRGSHEPSSPARKEESGTLERAGEQEVVPLVPPAR